MFVQLECVWCIRLHVPSLDVTYSTVFYSRITNDTVLHRAKCQKLSVLVRQSQLNLLAQILNDGDKKALRNLAFHGDSEFPEASLWVRRRGRPRQTWTEQLMVEGRRSV